MKISIIQHVAFEKPGLIAEWAQFHQHDVNIIEIFKQQKLPRIQDFDLLIVLGGPMSADDDISWLFEERRLIKEVVDQNKPMLGICLGAQQLAKAYGSRIVATPKEVGWASVTSSAAIQPLFSEDVHCTALHWHGEGFTLPEGAQRLFTSDLWENQGFMLKNAIGLQFHLETTLETLQNIIKNDTAFVENSKLEQSVADILATPPSAINKKILFQILDYLSQVAS